MDGIHFDDYFYPNGDVNDGDAFAKYGNGMNIGDFRRITRLNAKKAIIVGGNTVVDGNVEAALRNLGVSTIERLGGANRYDTNAMVIERFYGSSLNKVYASKGLVLVDALTAGPIAALNNGPIVLCNNDLTTVQKNILSLKSANAIVESGGGISRTSINSLKSALK